MKTSVFALTTVLFQTAWGLSVTPTPIPVAQAVATPVPVAEAVPVATRRQTIDALSMEQVQKSIEVLKSKFLAGNRIKDDELARATLEGLLERLGPGAAIVSLEPGQTRSPFKSEALNETAYLRLGALSQENVTALESDLKELAANGGVDAIILDLRATPASNDLELAAQVAMRFVPNGKTLFTARRPSKEQVYVSIMDPLFEKLLIVLVTEETAGAAEVLAGTLREQARAMIIGALTKGQGAEFADFPIAQGKQLRVAVAQVVLPSGKSFYPEGVKPDLQVNVSADARRELLQLELEEGVGKYVFEKERPKRNEAALVAGTNPEFDSAQLAQRKANGGKPLLRDVEVQRALDLITTISVYESKRSQ